jgi:RHS repeat-associated protein
MGFRSAWAVRLVILVGLLVTARVRADAQFTTLCVSGCVGVSVTPDAGQASALTNTTGNTVVFFVRNTGQVNATYSFTCTHTGTVTCAGISPASVTLEAGGDWEVTVTYSAGAIGSGTIRLWASGGGTDNGTYSIAVQQPGPPTVALRNHNRDNVDRSLCLTAGAGEAAAWSCGDLVVTHGMPGYATMGRERSPTLIHNSATAYPRPAIAAVVTQPTGITVPGAVYAEVRVGAGATTARTSATYVTGGWTSGAAGAKQIVLDFNGASDPTGAYPIQLRVRNQYTGATYETVVDDTLLIVNRFFGEFGAGFSLAGLEQLYFNQPVGTGLQHILWVGGDGSARLYRQLDSTTWVAPLGAFQDTLSLSGGVYTRTLRHGIKVQFNSAGRHTATINRTTQQTTFTWDSVGTRLVNITVPPAGATGTTYTLAWDANRNLDYIMDPAGRKLDATFAANDGRLTSLLDPDGKATVFGWDADRRMVSRKGRRGFTTRFVYAQGLAYGSRITKVTVPVGRTTSDTATAVTTFQPWNDKGLAVGSTGQTAVNTALAYTKVLGPRPNVADDASFWVDRWGAPVKSVDAITATTTIARSDALHPALVTRVTFPNGRIALMTYNDRGNLTQVRDSTKHLGAAGLPTKATVYTYDANGQAPDSPTEIADSNTTTGVGAYRSLYTYTDDGLTKTATDRRAHTTRLAYRTSGSLRGAVDSIIERQVETWKIGNTDIADAPDSQVVVFTYNAQGNALTSKSPSGVITSYVPDPLGRVTDVYDPLGRHQKVVYDALNRVTHSFRFTQKASHPNGVLPLQACDATQLSCGDSTRAVTGLPDSLGVRYFQGDAGVDSIADARGSTRRFLYDLRGLVWQEQDEYTRPRFATYDRSGALTRAVSRIKEVANGLPNPHRDTVWVQYDALGRRTSVSMTQTPYNGTEIVPADTMRYTYDIMGNVLTTSNAETTIRRTYFADGSLRSQTSVLPGGVDSSGYTYDRTGARATLSRTWSGTTDVITYNYNGTTGDLQGMTMSWGGVSPVSTLSFVWDALGRRRQITYPNGMVVKFRYDKQGILRRLVSANPVSILQQNDNFDFTVRADSVDASGQLMSEYILCSGNAGTTPETGSPCPAGSANGARTSNRFDRLGMLVTQIGPSGLQTMTYDAAGNLTSRQDPNLGLHYFQISSVSNRMIVDSAPGWSSSQVHLFNYTASGGRHRDYTQASNGLETDFRRFYYDGLGRSSGVRDFAHAGSNSHICMRYDADGNMALPCDVDAKWLSFDGPNVAGTMNSRWVFVSGPGVDDPLVGWHRNASIGPKEFYWVTDGRGRELAVGVANGTLGGIDEGDYLHSGGRFAGGTRDANSFESSRFEAGVAPGISSFRNRLYDQTTGRWTQEDPIGFAGGLNLYQFNGNNPVSYTDPFGLSPDGGVLEGGAAVYVLGLGLLTAATAVIQGDDLRSAAGAGLKAAGDALAGITSWAREKTDKLRKAWEGIHGVPWPKTADGRNKTAHHDVPLADGGADAGENIVPMDPSDHTQHHKDKGDFKRWGRRGAPNSAEPETPSSGGE